MENLVTLRFFKSDFISVVFSVILFSSYFVHNGDSIMPMYQTKQLQKAMLEFIRENSGTVNSTSNQNTTTSLPCNDLRGYAFHNETQKCWPLGAKGPCPQLMRFYEQQTHDGYGSCDCAAVHNCVGRPRTFWPENQQCYYLYSRGPCKRGEWLVFSKNGLPVCETNPCRRKRTRVRTQLDEFIFQHEGFCVRTGTQAFCGQNKTVYISSSDLKPRCYTSKPQCRFLIFTPQALSCRQGSRLNVTGQCSHVMRQM